MCVLNPVYRVLTVVQFQNLLLKTVPEQSRPVRELDIFCGCDVAWLWFAAWLHTSLTLLPFSKVCSSVVLIQFSEWCIG